MSSRHPRSSWARGDKKHQMAYYAPKGKGMSAVGTWKRFGFQLGLIARSPVPAADKIALSIDTLRRMRYDRGVLMRELGAQIIPR